MQKPASDDSVEKILNRFDNARLSKFHGTIFFSGGGGWMWAAFGTAIIGFILPYLKIEWSLESTQLGLIASCNLLGMLIGSVSAGYLADKIGRKTTLELAIFIAGFTALYISTGLELSFSSVFENICRLGAWCNITRSQYFGR